MKVIEARIFFGSIISLLLLWCLYSFYYQTAKPFFIKYKEYIKKICLYKKASIVPYPNACVTDMMVNTTVKEVDIINVIVI
jgi:hypothetical protein